jgi:hypothetical protein
MMKKLLRNLLFLTLLVATSVIFIGSIQPVYAQPDPCPTPPCDNEVPVSGIEWLILFGGLFGAKKIYSNFKKHRTN